MVGKLFIALLVLIVLGAIGLLGYGYLGDLSPNAEPTTIPVELNEN
ncbi:MAG: hypothetical protein QNI90_10020 [Dinoroseobacter sp.]|nr:hypothetical protein [Dinoroseobacter sp.]MDJ0993899.1 hypothetical protein [Dinoroseobacter sp.]